MFEPADSILNTSCKNYATLLSNATTTLENNDMVDTRNFDLKVTLHPLPEGPELLHE
jgi:hypothetical protein